MKHIDHTSHSAYLELRRISSICHLLMTKATARLMCSFVLSQLDCCNSLLIDINKSDVKGVKVQNHAAKVAFCKSRHEHTGSLLKALHWLPIKERITSMIAIFVFYFFDGTLPPYLLSCLCIHSFLALFHSGSVEKN